MKATIQPTMKQAIMTAPGTIEIREVPRPKPGPTQVLLRIEKIGICGSDIHVYHGKHPFTSYPVVQGHEVSGVVERLGSEAEASALKPGERVTIQPQIVCGRCYACTHGNYHICDHLAVLGFQAPGAASEYFAVDADKVLRFPERISFEQGAMVEPLAVAVHALGRHGKVTGKKILVLGAGPIGNLVAQAARALGADGVMIADISDFRLEVAERCGVDHTVNDGREDLSRAVERAFGRDKADLILECVGLNPTIDLAVENARKGTDIVVVGVFGEKAAVDLALLQDRELRLIGTLMYQRSDFETAIELIAGGRVSLEPLITDTFTFQDYPKAYRHIEQNGDRSLKVMISVREG